jgi:AmmeMemoRadiSam system protein B
MKTYRPAAVAGLFYPSDSKKLRDEVNLLLSISAVESYGNIFGIISPHAGYIYSGRTAAYGFNAVRGSNISKVIIISPSHREYFQGSSVYSGDGYETPLGIVEVEKSLTEKISSGSKTIFKGVEGHRSEHAIEVQIPFLQIVLKDFKIVPVVIGDQSKIFVDELAQKISEAIAEDTLVIASSDLSHYHTKYEADILDSIVEKRISRFQFNELQDDFEKAKCEACGAGPILALMKAAYLNNFKNSTVLNRSDSSDTSGNEREVVGYLSAVFYRH